MGDTQESRAAAAASYDYENDPRWPDYWGNILIPPNMAARPDVVLHFKRKFYQRFIVCSLSSPSLQSVGYVIYNYIIIIELSLGFVFLCNRISVITWFNCSWLTWMKLITVNSTISFGQGFHSSETWGKVFILRILFEGTDESLISSYTNYIWIWYLHKLSQTTNACLWIIYLRLCLYSYIYIYMQDPQLVVDPIPTSTISQTTRPSTSNPSNQARQQTSGGI